MTDDAERQTVEGGMTKPMRSTLILRGWRMGSLQKKIAKAEAQGYELHGAIQYAPVGRKYLATMVLRVPS